MFHYKLNKSNIFKHITDFKKGQVPGLVSVNQKAYICTCIFIFLLDTNRWETGLNACFIREQSHHWAQTGPFALGTSLKYRLSCAVLQKHLNLRWQECVQLISSTVAPSSGFLVHNTEHHRKSEANTLKHNRCGRRGGCRTPLVHCPNVLLCCESHLPQCDLRVQKTHFYNTTRTLYYKHTHRRETLHFSASHRCTHAHLYIIYIIT